VVTAQWPSYAGRSPYSGRLVKRPRNTQVSSPVPGKGSLTLVGVGRRLDLLRRTHIGALRLALGPTRLYARLAWRERRRNSAFRSIQARLGLWRQISGCRVGTCAIVL
jgi:hypothetical protein